MDIIKTPQTDVQSFLYNELNIEIYNELTEDDDYKNLFEPLEFFNMLYSTAEFYLNYDESYLKIKKHFNKLPFENEEKSYFFLWWLKELIEQSHHSDSPNAIQKKSFEVINDLFDKLEAKLYPAKEDEKTENTYDFSKVKKHLQTITNNKDKVNYLIEIKTDYLQNQNSWKLNDSWEIPFDQKCDLEIDKLKSFLKTTEPRHSTTTNVQSKLNWQGTQTEFIELIKALIQNENIKGTQTEIIKTLSGVFNIEIKNPNKIITDIKNRNNGSETLFLDKLKKALFDYITVEKK